jgi:hypothetical protein
VLYDNVNQLILSGFSCNNSKAESDVFIDRLVQLILSDFPPATPPPSPQYFPINYTSLFYRGSLNNPTAFGLVFVDSLDQSIISEFSRNNSTAASEVLPDKIYQSILSGFSRNKSTAEQHVLPDSIRQSILYKLYFQLHRRYGRVARQPNPPYFINVLSQQLHRFVCRISR